MRRAARWLARHPLLAALGVIVVVATPGFVRVEQINTQQDRAAEQREQLVRCVSTWADEFTARAAALNTAGNLRADALDTVLRNVFDQIATGRSDPAAFRQRLADYVAASDTYKQSQVDNPVPDPPRIRC